jgi:hypothetical protein
LALQEADKASRVRCSQSPCPRDGIESPEVTVGFRGFLQSNSHGPAIGHSDAGKASVSPLAELWDNNEICSVAALQSYPYDTPGKHTQAVREHDSGRRHCPQDMGKNVVLSRDDRALGQVADRLGGNARTTGGAVESAGHKFACDHSGTCGNPLPLQPTTLSSIERARSAGELSASPLWTLSQQPIHSSVTVDHGISAAQSKALLKGFFRRRRRKAWVTRCAQRAWAACCADIAEGNSTTVDCA